ncbi:MAG: DnaJ domain-containing protein [Rhodoferax sp.]|nr:DnaJ domain-containing protein [Rhodoferax sp.]
MIDPYRELGVGTDADDASIRSAYLTAIRACPPERDAARFERIRRAFEAISDARKRRSHALFDTSLPTPADVLHAVGADFVPGPVRLDHLRRVLGG